MIGSTLHQIRWHLFGVAVSVAVSVAASVSAGAQGNTGGAGVAGAVDSGAALDSVAVALDTVPLVPETTITLADAMAGAMQTSPVTAGARAGVRVARSTQRVAFGEFLPSLDVTSAWYHAGTPSLGDSPTGVTLSGVGGEDAGTSAAVIRPMPAALRGSVFPDATTVPLPQTTTPVLGGTSISGPYNNAYAQAVAGIDLFTAGRRLADAAFARALTRAARSNETEQQFAVRGVVKTAFYNVMRDEDLEDVAQAQVRRAGEDLRAAQRRRAVGTATPADVLQFALNLNAARQALLQAITNRRSDAYALGRLAGLSGPAEAQRGPDLAPTPLALSDTAVIQLAATAAPTLVAAVDSERAAEAAVRAARTQYLPTIRAGGGYTVVQTEVPSSTIQPGWSVQIGTAFPVFNGFVREDAIERATAARMVAQVTARDAERNALAQAEALLGGVRLAAEQIRLSQVSLANAQENYRVEQARYRNGVATVLDLAVAEQDLATAEAGLVNARYDYQLARASLETLVGRDL